MNPWTKFWIGLLLIPIATCLLWAGALNKSDGNQETRIGGLEIEMLSLQRADAANAQRFESIKETLDRIERKVDAAATKPPR